MKRRAFVKSAMGAVSLVGLSRISSTTATAQGAGAQNPQYYELRIYAIRSEDQKKLIDDYWRNAAIPAFNRLGIRPIGVFTELDRPEVTKVYVLIPYNSLDSLASLASHLESDKEYQKAGANYLNASKLEAAYVRFDSSISRAFEGMKKLEVPQSPAENKPRIFELRTYESHSESRSDNKVKMFNSGEIELMHEVGLGPVFFGHTVIGGQMPNLVYMVSGENKELHKEHWDAFFAAPVWKKLIGDPQYKDNVSKVTSVFLKRTEYSQI